MKQKNLPNEIAIHCYDGIVSESESDCDTWLCGNVPSIIDKDEEIYIKKSSVEKLKDDILKTLDKGCVRYEQNTSDMKCLRKAINLFDKLLK